MKQIKQFTNTIAGIVIVFCFLVTFCITYYTIKTLLDNSTYALISGIISDIIISMAFATDLYIRYHHRSGKQPSEDLLPKGIGDSAYPEHEDENRIPYDIKTHKKLVENKLKKSA